MMSADIKVKIVVTTAQYVQNAYVGSWDGFSKNIINAVPVPIADGKGEVELTIKAYHFPFFCCNSGANSHIVTMYYNASENVGAAPWEVYENQLYFSEQNHNTQMTIYSDDGQTIIKTQGANVKNKYSDTVFEVDTPCMIVADTLLALQNAQVGSWSGDGTSVVNAVPVVLYDRGKWIYFAKLTIKAGCKPYYCVESGFTEHVVTMYY
jgi:hypothetical protein